MMDMREKGVDIYFSGFSQMKRFPFFSSLVNWFVPFISIIPNLNRHHKNCSIRVSCRQCSPMPPSATLTNIRWYSACRKFTENAARISRALP